MKIYNFDIPVDDIIKIALAVGCGGLLGIERQYKNKTAGFRTIILICLGATIYTLVAQRAGAGVNINIVTGIGFIGAGVIFKDSISVNGLTTAAVIWMSAAIGMAIGTNNYMLGISSSVLTVSVLWSFHFLERYIDKIHHDKVYNITFNTADFDDVEIVEEMVKAHDLHSIRVQINKYNDNLQFAIKVSGHRKNISKLDKEFLKMEKIKSF
jgi:putative Mg2+ transporter-C (MgtC) family protein